MTDGAFFRKIQIFADLTNEELALLTEATSDIRLTAAKRDIIKEGDRPEVLHLVVDGWAARYKTLPNGSRQIVAILIPGDFCDLHSKILRVMDHTIVALTPCRVAWIQSDRFDRLTSEFPNLTRALWWGTLLDEAILRNWVTNIGRRTAYERVAHLLCEIHARMHMIGLADDGRFDLPLTQEDLADATGLTSVHINRTLQRLRAENLIDLSARVLTVRNVSDLKRAAGFDPVYLHIQRRGRSSN